jgi:hypothetical protein
MGSDDVIQNTFLLLLILLEALCFLLLVVDPSRQTVAAGQALPPAVGLCSLNDKSIAKEKCSTSLLYGRIQKKQNTFKIILIFNYMIASYY